MSNAHIVGTRVTSATTIRDLGIVRSSSWRLQLEIRVSLGVPFGDYNSHRLFSHAMNEGCAEADVTC